MPVLDAHYQDINVSAACSQELSRLPLLISASDVSKRRPELGTVHGGIYAIDRALSGSSFHINRVSKMNNLRNVSRLDARTDLFGVK